MEEEAESEPQLSQEQEQEVPIHPPPLHNSNVHFVDNSEYGDVPELDKKIDRIAVMTGNKALVVEQIILEKRAVDTAMNKLQGL